MVCTNVLRASALGEQDIHLFREGTHGRLYDKLGCHLDGDAAHFTVWAPNAEAVSVLGEFNDWTTGRDEARSRGDGSGLWEATVRGVSAGQVYKYAIRSRDGELLMKADPFARRAELPPATGSVVWPGAAFAWGDGAWMDARAKRDTLAAPMSVYEVHLGSWRRGEGGALLDYRSAARLLADYAVRLGFTHVELMPVTEHPFYGSWG